MNIKKTTGRLFLLALLLVGNFASTQAYAFESFVVQQIQVEGLRRVSRAAVINELPLHTGETLTQEKASQIIQTLYHTGFFKTVSLSQSGNTLVIHVVERPIISKFTLEGVREKDKIQKILNEAGVAQGRLYDPNGINQAQREIEKYYFSRGRYSVKVEPCITEISPGLMEVKFAVYEGDIAKIKQIKIIGNCAFSESALISGFYSHKTNWLSWFKGDDQYAKEKLNADLEILRSYYLDRGYIHIQIDSVQVSLTPEKKNIYITIHITEGPKYCFGQVSLTGQTPVPRDKLLCLLKPIQPGKTFSRKTLLDVKQALEDTLGCEGFSTAEAQFEPYIDEKTRVVNVAFNVVPGRQVYVRRIQFSGNFTTKDEVLRQELPQLEGARISTELVREGKDNILRRGFASNVEVETIPVPGSPDQVDLVYKMDEAKMGQVGLGVGYSQTEGFMVNASLNQENFLGTGKMVDFSFDKSQASTNYSFGYQDPFFTVDRIGMGASVYYNESKLSKTTDLSVYTTDTLGGEFRWVFPLSRFDALTTSIGYDDTRLKINYRDAAIELQNFVNRYGTRFQEYVVGVGWRYNSLDRPIFPRCGISQSLTIGYVLPGAKQQYYRSSYEFAWYQPIDQAQRWIINISSTLGYADGYGKTPDLPFYRNFVAGGTRFVRGFEENSLGPKDSQGRALGGNALVAATAALIFPNPIKPDLESVRTALFLDAGQVYDTHNRKTLINGQLRSRGGGGLRYSVGVALSWHLPIGGAPITISLAKPLNKQKGDIERNWGFSLAAQF